MLIYFGELSTDQQESDQRAIHQSHFFKACFTLSNKFLKLNFVQNRL
jgi:hypothetical protein